MNAMKASELAALLLKHPDMPVVVDGYESGSDDLRENRCFIEAVGADANDGTSYEGQHQCKGWPDTQTVNVIVLSRSDRHETDQPL